MGKKRPSTTKVFRYDPKKKKVVQVKKPSKRNTIAKWPIYPEGLGVSVDQIPEAERKMSAEGVKVHYDSETGLPEIVDKRHYREVCAVSGQYMRNGGYSDPQRNHVVPKEERRRSMFS
jgi:hypothetical protein